MTTIRSRFLIITGCIITVSLSHSIPTYAGGHNKKMQNQFLCDSVRDKRLALGTNALPREYSMLLLEASEKGCIDEAEVLIEKGALIQVKDRMANTPIIRAASAGQLETLQYLHARGGSIDQPNLRGATALIQAVKNHRKSTVQWLLSQSVDVNALTLDNETPLSIAAFDGNLRFVRALLDAGADPVKRDNTGKSAIIYAAAKGFHQVVAALLSAGADPNEVFTNDTTILMWASGHTTDTPHNDALKTVQLLLEAGAKVDLQDNRGMAAIDYARQANNRQIEELLITLTTP